MAFQDIYKKQVRLLVRTLPYVSQEECFALKGGTAINLFVRDMPRLSVDIDLTFLPEASRDKALTDIDAALKRVAGKVKGTDKGIQITESAPGTQTTINKLIIRSADQVQIKIEVTPVLRGCVYPPKLRTIVEKAEDIFGFAEIIVLSFADLYAGKIIAALDRQHPRDLYDIHHLLNNEGIGDELRTAMIIYLISHDHSPHSLLAPKFKDISHEYKTNFIGMTEEAFPILKLETARENLVKDILLNMPENHKEFLSSFYKREPEWSLLEIEGINNLPAVRWREINLDKAGKDTRDNLVSQLEEIIF